MIALAELVETVPALAGRVHPAAKLSELQARNQLGQVDTGAFILPLGLRGGRPDVVTGMFRQSIERMFGVVLVVRAAGDATGKAALTRLEPLIDAVIEAVAGVAANDFGVFALAKGELVSLSTGTLIYQLDFGIEDQLRIAR